VPLKTFSCTLLGRRANRLQDYLEIRIHKENKMNFSGTKEAHHATTPWAVFLEMF
jgi:hypothetical protein